jgi:hypothetical protein
VGGSDHFTLRRRLAIGVIAALILVPIYMLFIRDDNSSTSQSALSQAVNDPNKAAEVLLEQVGDPSQGITIRFPNGWNGVKVGSVVRAKSSDGRTVIAVTTAGPASQAPAIFKSAVDGISSSYEKPSVKLIPANQQPSIAGLPTAGAVVSGKLKGGAASTTLVSVVRSKRRAYVVSAIIPADGGELPTANLILSRGLILSG